MNRSMFSGRYLLILVVAVVLLTRVIGVWEWSKPSYQCFDGAHFRFDKKVLVFQWGSFRGYYFPVVRDCPEKERYPNDGNYKQSNSSSTR